MVRSSLSLISSILAVPMCVLTALVACVLFPFPFSFFSFSSASFFFLRHSLALGPGFWQYKHLTLLLSALSPFCLIGAILLRDAAVPAHRPSSLRIQSWIFCGVRSLGSPDAKIVDVTAE